MYEGVCVVGNGFCRNEEFVSSVFRYVLNMKAARLAKKLDLSIGDDLSLDGAGIGLLKDYIKENNK